MGGCKRNSTHYYSMNFICIAFPTTSVLLIITLYSTTVFAESFKTSRRTARTQADSCKQPPQLTAVLVQLWPTVLPAVVHSQFSCAMTMSFPLKRGLRLWVWWVLQASQTDSVLINILPYKYHCLQSLMGITPEVWLVVKATFRACYLFLLLLQDNI